MSEQEPPEPIIVSKEKLVDSVLDIVESGRLELGGDPISIKIEGEETNLLLTDPSLVAELNETLSDPDRFIEAVERRVDQKIADRKVLDEADGYLKRLAPKSKEEADQMVETLKRYVYQKLALFEQGILTEPDTESDPEPGQNGQREG